MVRWPFLLMLVKQDLRTCDGKNNFKHNKNKFKSTFFPRTIVDWNELPEKTDELSLGSRIDGHLQSSRCAWVLALYPVYRPSTVAARCAYKGCCNTLLSGYMLRPQIHKQAPGGVDDLPRSLPCTETFTLVDVLECESDLLTLCAVIFPMRRISVSDYITL